METLQKSLHFRVFSYLFRFLARFPTEKKRPAIDDAKEQSLLTLEQKFFGFRTDFPLVQVYSPIAFTVHTQNST